MGRNLHYKPFYPLFGSVYSAPVVSQRAPSANDKGYEAGQIWIDQPNDDGYILTRINAGSPVWMGIGGGTGTFSSLTVSPGNITAAVGNIAATLGSISSGAGMVAATGVTATTGGLLASAGDITATLGDIISSAGAVSAATSVGSGTTMSCGTDLDVGGTVTITPLSTAGILSNTAAGVVQSSAGSNGQLILGATGAAPAWGSLAAGSTNLVVTTGVNTLSLDLGTNVTITGSLTIGSDLDLVNSAADATGFDLGLYKNRTLGIITTGDTLGTFSFYGMDDAPAYIQAAYIKSVSSGTIATDRIPSNLEFYTHPDSVLASIKRMDIDTDGAVTIAAPDGGGVGLTIAGGGLEIDADGFYALGDSAIDGDLEIANEDDTATSPKLDLMKNRLTGVITSGDELGGIRFYGHDGTGDILGSGIKSVNSGTVATDRIAANLEFWTHRDTTDAAIQRMVINPDGAVTINAPSAGTGLTVAGGGVEFEGDGNISGDWEVYNEDVAVTAPVIGLVKNRTSGVITTGDELGELNFYGDDGTNNKLGAGIKSVSSGTIATGRVPANMEFYTAPDSVSAALKRMDIDTAGKVTIAAPDAGTGLTVSGGGAKVTGGIEEATADITITTATKGVILPGGLKVITGAGSPHGSITAPLGSLYLNTTGSGVNDRAWINTNAGTNWTYLVSGA